jgi:hypothetical protein
MSKKTDQSVVLLCTLADIINTLKTVNSFSRVDVRKNLDVAIENARYAAENFRGIDNRHWQKSCVDKWKTFIANHPDSGYSTPALFAMCEQIIIDLVELHGHNREKNEMLCPIFDAVKCIRKFCDRDGLDFVAFEKGKELIDELYRIVELKEFV